MKRLLRVAAALGLAALAFAAYVAAGLPSRSDVQALARRDPGRTAVMQQREDEARVARRTLRRAQTWVPLSRISRHLIAAVLIAEDARFFGHDGIDWAAVQESLRADVKERAFLRGGSTITQQLAKNLFFSTEKSPVRKLRELIVARWMEAALSKRRILEMYLNVIEWGDGVYGCEAAAQRYYGKPAAELSEAEAAGLAAMIPSPRRLNPRVNPAGHARAQLRVLWLMAHAGYVKQSVAGLGSEPAPEVVEDTGPEPVESESPSPTPSPSDVVAPPSPDAPSPSPTPSPTSSTIPGVSEALWRTAAHNAGPRCPRAFPPGSGNSPWAR